MRRWLFKELVITSWLCIFCNSSEAGPRHVYLTWQGDTSTTITVNYQTIEEAQSSHVYYDTKSRQGKIADYRFHAGGTGHSIDGLADGRTIHWVELTSLKPGQSYYFVAGDEVRALVARDAVVASSSHQKVAIDATYQHIVAVVAV